MRSYGRTPLYFTEALYHRMYYASPTITRLFHDFAEPNGKGNYVDIATDGQVSWRPLNRITLDIDPYVTSGRVRGKPAKAIKAFLGERAILIADTAWEEFANRFEAHAQIDNTRLEMVDGEDIAKYYHEVNHTKIKVVYPLRSSCMRYDYCQPYLKLYTKNPNQVQMLVELDGEGKVCGRALVWKLDRGETLMDRIYADNRSIEAFRKYAIDNGWWYRAHNTYGYPSLVMVDGESRRRSSKVTIDHVPDKFPFCDTMLWLSMDSGVLANSKTPLKGMRNVVQLRHTDGRYILR